MVVNINERNTTLSPLRLDEESLRVYRYTVGREDVSEQELRATLGMDGVTVQASVRRLLELGLLSRTQGAETRLSAVPPDTAWVRVLGPAMREVARRQEEIDRVRTELEILTPVYRASLVRRLRQSSVEVFHELGTVRAVITELAAGSRTEVLTSQPGGARRESVLRESLRRTEELLGRDVRMRTLYQHVARFSQPTIAYVEHVTRLGSQVRTCANGLLRLIVFDRETAVLPLCRNPHGAVVVRDPSIVEFVAETFENAWVGGTPFLTEYDKKQVLSLSDDVKRRIVQLLVEGETEKVIARQLGMSVRTCQRHIADIMQRLAARNRLHAGYLIAQQGLV